jgi:hypothetical protein
MNKQEDFRQIERLLRNFPKPTLTKEADERILQAIMESSRKIKKRQKLTSKLRNLKMGLTVTFALFIFTFILLTNMNQRDDQVKIEEIANHENIPNDAASNGKASEQENDPTGDQNIPSDSEYNESKKIVQLTTLPMFNGDIDKKGTPLAIHHDEFTSARTKFFEERPQLLNRFAMMEFTDFHLEESWSGSVTGEVIQLDFYSHPDDLVLIVSRFGEDQLTAFISVQQLRPLIFYGESVFLMDREDNTGRTLQFREGKFSGYTEKELNAFIEAWENLEPSVTNEPFLFLQNTITMKDERVIVITADQ